MQTTLRNLLNRLIPSLGLFFLLAPLIAWPAPETPERIEWNKTPIKLVLSVDQERQLRFPAAVRVGVPPPVEASLRTQSVDGTVYLIARQAIDTTRVMVRETGSGRTYLLDIHAVKEGGSSQPVEIFVPGSSHPEGLATDAETTAPARTFGYVKLTRFAAQQMYAPKRLLYEPSGVSRVPLTDEAIKLVRGATVEATPLISWHAGALYLTAVKLTNITDQPLVLDPRRLRGRWLTATFQHARLFPAADEADTTCVYLISTRPFEASL
jgi:integrating conjugative element protein (TIGR03749 family)